MNIAAKERRAGARTAESASPHFNSCVLADSAVRAPAERELCAPLRSFAAKSFSP